MTSAFALAVGLATWSAPSRASGSECLEPRASEMARAVAVDGRGELTLGDGRTISLPDVLLPDDGPAGEFAETRRALTSWLVGRAVALAPVESEPDRWGATLARLYYRADRQGRWIWVERKLAEEGLARIAPQFESADCLAPLLAAEARARASARGLWRDPFYSVLPAARLDAFAGRFAEMTIIEGRVVSLGRTRNWDYLNFGDDRRRDLALVVPKAARARFDVVGSQLSQFVGRLIRARGELRFWSGPQIEIRSPTQIETIDVGSRS